MKNNKFRKVDNGQAIAMAKLIHQDDDGYTTLAVLPKGGKKLRQMFAKGQEELVKKLYNTYTPNCDIYMSVNSTYCPKRDKGCITNLNSIFMDIDCHKKNRLFTPNHVYASIEYVLMFLDNKLPYPNIVNFSGRGIHLYWLLDNENYKKTKEFIAVSNAFCNIISEHLNNGFNDENSKPIKSGYTVDFPISKDTARIMRVAGTYNQKTGTRCESKIIHEQRFKLDDLIEKYGISTKQIIEFKPSKNKSFKSRNKVDKHGNILYFKDYETDVPKATILYKRRIKDLETLVDLRIAASEEMWCRKRILFLYRHFALCANYSCQEALDMTIALNKRFAEPLCFKELEAQTYSAEKAYINKTYYYYKTTTLIELLEINQNEFKYLNTLVDSDTRRYRTNERRRQSYGFRDHNGLTIKQREMLKARILIAKCVEDGYTQAEIVELTGYSLSKVKRLRAELKATTRHLNAPNDTIKNKVIVLYQRNFNQKYSKIVGSSVFRLPYMNYLSSYKLDTVCEQLSMVLDGSYSSQMANSS